MEPFKPSKFQAEIIKALQEGKTFKSINHLRGKSYGRPFYVKIIANGERKFEVTLQASSLVYAVEMSVKLPNHIPCNIAKGNSGGAENYSFIPYRRRWVGMELRIYAKGYNGPIDK